jgi:3,4-dihydroxy 2-butanone 4-phosphate synthase/GTP cyclohydrolase II
MEKALADFKLGNPIIVLDDTDRENEADIIIPAQFATTAMINKFIRNSTGIICVPMTESKAVQLGLTQMVTNNTDPNGTNYTITCDAVNCGTGVSAEDRTKTILTLADPNSDKSKVRTPGHIFGLVAKPGLLNQRRGHTEASIQLCLLANLEPISVIVELMNPDGTMTRLDDISKNPALEDIPVISIKDIITYSTAGFYIPKPPLYTSECNLVINLNGIPTTFKTILFKDYFIGEEICVLQFGDIGEETYLRIHSECFTGKNNF